ncbi:MULTISPECIES: hypothetical protein [Photobacterium]|uniref:Thymidylate kinase n=1 Tax=Photobacterium ganghwense TaxID=320778 RepID=A0A0J1H8S3_9GAMM|nr:MULTISPECIES: hypothetical protein [Photobacterium]KLV08118.1 hypothetical protein ABT57_14970 [Photobacterium ganghwense]MBV1839796.1 hypothetical protein [Photobacterium ganghwense]PSU07239.1 hypothetical protein C9I92_15990 [Photobacterium ganghwense]QSV15992.1 hypothetical protein FH974_22400 [Photobacterium ganghwense]
MVLSECRQLMSQHSFVEARLVHDFLSAGWSIHFIDYEGNDVPLTDTYGIPCSFDSLKQAEDQVNQVGECPVRIDSLFRFAER